MNKLASAVLARAAVATGFDVRTLQHRLAIQTGAESIAASAVLSLHDSPGRPDPFLLELVAPLVDACRAESLPVLASRGAPEWCFCWPGEHYRLLAALAAILRPQAVLEIGTGTGLGFLSMQPRLAPDAELLTVDVIPWDSITNCLGRARGSFLQPGDFDGRRSRQLVGSLADEAVFASAAEVFRRADLIVVDGPKDGVFEDILLRRMAQAELRRGAVVVLDDIRLVNMLATWRGIARPKFDATSIGHYAGTGLVHWL